MKVSWSASSDDVGVAGYDLYKNGTLLSNTEGTWAIFGAGIPLTCGTSYTFGVAAYDATGNRSEVASLIASTSPCADTQAPSAPSGVVQVAKTASSATVSWSPSSDNIGVVGYSAYQGGIRVAQIAQTSYSFSNLACGTSTTVGLDAYDAAGNRSAQTSFVVSTSACSDTQPPSAPSGLTKTGSTDTSISLKWNPSTDNVGITSYQLLSNGAAVASTSGTSYTISGLTCGKSYTIGVAAYDAAGNHSAWTSAAMATNACPPPPPPGSDTTPPTSPTNLAVMSTTASSIRVKWSPSSDNVGVTGYDLYKNGALLSTTSGTDVIFGAGIPLTCGTSYTFGVKAYDAAGNRSALVSIIASTSACADSQPPTAPSNLTMSSRTATSISLTWSPATDNLGVVGYGVYKAGASVGSTPTTSYTVTGLSCGTSYTIAVDAYDASGNRSSQAVVMMATTTCSDTQPPSAPTNLTTANVGQTSLTLSWTASTDNVGVAGYDMFANGTKIGASTTATSNTLAGLTCGTAYTLGVEAFDAVGNRSTRATKSVTMAACSTPSTGSVYISPSGSDGNPCTQASPCASFDRAYHVAASGATVIVGGGTYPVQRITYDASKTSSTDVVFKEAAGQSAFVNGDLLLGDTSGSLGPKHITIDGIDGNDGIGTRCFVDDVTIQNVKWPVPVVTGSSNVTIQNSEFGPAINRVFNITDGGCGVVTSNITIRGNYFHDSLVTGYVYPAPNGYHSECIQQDLGRTDRLTIENNVLQNCQDFGILFNGGNTNLVVQNNMIDNPFQRIVGQESAKLGAATPRGGSSIRLACNPSCSSNVTIRYNSVLGNIVVDNGNSGVAVAGNVAGNSSCTNGTASYNVWAGTSCGTGDKQATISSLFVDGSPSDGTMDLHLRSGTVASDAGDPSNYPSSDIDGRGRPMGGRSDIGAHEQS